MVGGNLGAGRPGTVRVGTRSLGSAFRSSSSGLVSYEGIVVGGVGTLMVVVVDDVASGSVVEVVDVVLVASDVVVVVPAMVVDVPGTDDEVVGSGGGGGSEGMGMSPKSGKSSWEQSSGVPVSPRRKSQ